MPPETKDDLYTGIRACTEQEAIVLFELPELRQAALDTQRHFQDADTHATEAQELQRSAHQCNERCNAGKHEAQGVPQGEGGRLKHVEANKEWVSHLRTMGEALLKQAEAEEATRQGEHAWATVAHRHQCYVSQARRLEVLAKERDGYVYCWDATNDELGLHPMNDPANQKAGCPSKPLRHDRGTTMLRRGKGDGKLHPLPGQKES